MELPLAGTVSGRTTLSYSNPWPDLIRRPAHRDRATAPEGTPTGHSFMMFDILFGASSQLLRDTPPTLVVYCGLESKNTALSNIDNETQKSTNAPIITLQATERALEILAF